MTDAVVIGSGPNGLAAAIVLAQAGLAVTVYEANDTLGGSVRSLPLTLPGFTHDIGSSVFPLAAASPFLQTLPLPELEWLYPDIAFAHPFADGTAALVHRSLEVTSEGLADGASYRRLFEPLVERAPLLWEDFLAPMHVLHHPIASARFGLHGLRAAASLARSRFKNAQTQAVFAGLAAHSFLPLTTMGTAAFGLVLGITAHAPGWPFAKGGAQAIVNALVRYGRSLGVQYVTSHRVKHIDELPHARAYLFDTSPKHLADIAGSQLPESYCAKLLRFRYGPSVFKLDWALSEPIPWRAHACTNASTVHVGGTLEDIVASERLTNEGRLPDKLFILVTQPTSIDSTRAPAGKHIGWAYAHVPYGYEGDLTTQIETQIEAYAPGFRDTILARSVSTPRDIERHNANCMGGHIVGGANSLSQLWKRPVSIRAPYSTPNPSIYICSASTPPGGGVHGMCGFYAARAALRRRFG